MRQAMFNCFRLFSKTDSILTARAYFHEIYTVEARPYGVNDAEI
jgi:hypothetical protein